MKYSSLSECVVDLEKNGHLIRVKEEVDPHLQMASIHLRVHQNNGPALLFEKVKGSNFPAVSNLFGTLDRSRFMFRSTLDQVKKMVRLKGDPMQALKHPLQNAALPFAALKALPKRSRGKTAVEYGQCKISDLPQIVHWPMDGGPYVTLPVVYTEDIHKPGVMKSNLGMYRIQLGGNNYIQDQGI
jgi:4-hydroxy-3-polyprenylbenzoate decarboxylase